MAGAQTSLASELVHKCTCLNGAVYPPHSKRFPCHDYHIAVVRYLLTDQQPNTHSPKANQLHDKINNPCQDQ